MYGASRKGRHGLHEILRLFFEAEEGFVQPVSNVLFYVGFCPKDADSFGHNVLSAEVDKGGFERAPTRDVRDPAVLRMNDLKIEKRLAH